MVTVVNGRTHGWKGTQYIGRADFGNPFIIGVHGARDKCVELFREWFHSSDPHAIAMREAASRLPRDAVLSCYCKPAACHGDVIAAFINSHSA